MRVIESRFFFVCYETKFHIAEITKIKYKEMKETVRKEKGSMEKVKLNHLIPKIHRK